MVDFKYGSSYDVSDFRKIIELLRSPEGCMWDREQTHGSIRRNLIEEAWEVVEAIDEGDPRHLKEELGDLLMQVIFHTRIEEEAGSFDLDDVADAACKKLINRHPHVFGETRVESSAEILLNWDEIKKRERSQETTAESMASVAKSLPALWRAEKIQKKAKKAGFDWPDISGALDKLDEELNELREAAGGSGDPGEELGDLLFAAVNTARFLGIDPEMALHASCDKFTARFAYVEREAKNRGQALSEMSLDDMEAIYQIGKSVVKDQ